MSVQRCPFCGALLDVEWSKAHAPHCVHRIPEPPDYRIPQDEDET